MLFIWNFPSLISPFNFKNLAFISLRHFIMNICKHLEDRENFRVNSHRPSMEVLQFLFYFNSFSHVARPASTHWSVILQCISKQFTKIDVVPPCNPCIWRWRLENLKFKARLSYILRPNIKQTKAILLPMHRLNNISLTKVYYFPSFGATYIYRTKSTSLKYTISLSLSWTTIHLCI